MYSPDNEYSLRRNFRGVIETTLREGEQNSSVNFSPDQKVRIVEVLRDIGVERIEVSNPIGEATRADLKLLTQVANRPPFVAHIRNRLQDLVAAHESGVEGVHILCTIKPERLASMRQSLEEHIGVLQQVILQAKEWKLETRVGVEHYFNGDNKEEALYIYQVADSLKVDRISVPDTLGTAKSWHIQEEISALRRLVRADIEFHGHNEFMNATGNAFTAVRYGANWIDASLAGIGERTGITPLGSFLAGLYSEDPTIVDHYHLELLTPAEMMIAEMMGIELPFNLITNPRYAFTHKSGVHLTAVLRHGKLQYQAFDERVIGGQINMVVGTAISGKTTKDQAAQFLQQNGNTPIYKNS